MGHLDLPGHYRRKIRQLVYEYNRPFPLPFYFDRFLSRRNSVKIADIGSGPICTLGNIWSNTIIKIYASDLRAKAYNKLVNSLNCKPITPIEYQDMENLTYPDDFFDVVHCVNALDHTPNAQKALKEMYRVCKSGGFIYLRHFHSQRRVHKGNGHFWDANSTGFSDGKIHISLEGFSTTDDGRYIISVLNKP